MHAIGRSARLLAATVASAALHFPCPGAAADAPQAYAALAGLDIAPQSLVWYSEAVVALNGDMAKSGFLLRSFGSLSVYEYASTLVPGETIDGRLWQIDLMPGYQIVRGPETLGGHIGLDYQRSLLDPDDPTNAVRGTATGFKVSASYAFSDDKEPLDALLVGEYSTAFATYYAEARVGVRVFDKLYVGPDAEADGDTGYNGQRLGGYAKYAFDLGHGASAEASLSLGHQFVSGGGSGVGGGEGTYATLELDTGF